MCAPNGPHILVLAVWVNYIPLRTILILIMFTLVGQRMAIRLMRQDGDDSRAQYIEVYLSVYL